MMLKDHKQLPQAKGVWVFAHKYVQYLCICNNNYLYNYYIYIIMYHTYSGAKTQAPVSQEAFRFVSLKIQYRFPLHLFIFTAIIPMYSSIYKKTFLVLAPGTTEEFLYSFWN